MHRINSVKSGRLIINRVGGKTLTLSVSIIMAVILGNLAVLYSSLNRVREHNRRVTETHEVLYALEQTYSSLKDSEVDVLAFLSSGKEPFLQSFYAMRSAGLEHVRTLGNLTSQDPVQHQKAGILWEKSLAFMQWQSAAIDETRQDKIRAGTLTQAKAHMDEIRLIVQDMKDTESRKLRQRAQQAETASYRQELSILAVAGVSVLLVLLVQYYIRRSMHLQAAASQRLEDENWLKTGLAEISGKLRGKETLDDVGRVVLEFFARQLGMQVGAFYVFRQSHLELAATFGQTGDVGAFQERIGLLDSLTGEALAQNRLIELDPLPQNYVKVSSALGSTVPGKLIILPLYTDNNPRVGVVEMGFLQALPSGALDLFDDLTGMLSAVITSTLAKQKQQELLEETQRQAEELAAQQEELRASNEKLEQQTTALRSSQERLQVQQEELRQTNEELEQQARAVAQQKEALAEKNLKLLATTSELQEKAHELEQASRYKSEFLANMSHELRTPLNSLLLLATLLAENKDETLNAMQVEFAQTIYKSGCDLLALINDILDLSKVEAGRLDLVRQEVDLDELIQSLKRDFQHTALEKGIGFEIHRSAATPKWIATDSQRLLQIMKNLISNAVKFTPEGKVQISLDFVEGPTPIVFKVRDTGVGIAEDKQALIFEAFKQSDGSISRTYGGTGLGLSISRELARLLGGHIAVESKPGMGSTFSLSLPLDLPESEPQESSLVLPPQSPSSQPAAPISEPLMESLPTAQKDDSSLALEPDDRLILVVEDDVIFGRIVSELAQEAGFKTVLATTGEAALQLAFRYPLSAVLLDIKLPDISGLVVLERLKSDPTTRHVPIHVISASDYVQNALSLGAMGYLQKPAQPKDLKEIFSRIEATLARKVKRVLIVEDDKFQRQATKELLGHGDIEIVEARSGAEAREKLWNETLDCVVLDLRLPDISGFELLETMNRDLPGPKPPIVVYTAKDLTRDEQERLERYAESIVIKGARSPERLLDEVSLFLHRLESSLPPQSQSLLQKLRADAVGLRGRRILVVDDDMRNVYALVNALESHGLKLVVARNGRECLSQLDKDPEIELVLMDIMMPEMDGYEAMRRIRENPLLTKLPIIALTAKAMKGDLEQCLAAGANDYLPKPINLERLLSLLKVWLPQKI